MRNTDFGYNQIKFPNEENNAHKTASSVLCFSILILNPGKSIFVLVQN